MGKHCAFRSEFNKHPLAACLTNYTEVIDAEREEQSPRSAQSFLNELIWIGNVAAFVNKYCDSNRVDTDQAAQYWLERFLWLHLDNIVDLDMLAGWLINTGASSY